VLLALLRTGGFLERMGEALLGEFGAAGLKALFIRFFRGKNRDDIVFGVGLVALKNHVRYPRPGTFVSVDQATHLQTLIPL
jgi:hypothetical protein